MEIQGEHHHDAVISFVREHDAVDATVGKKAYRCTLDDGGEAICVVYPNNEYTKHWYKFVMANTSDFILRMFFKTEAQAKDEDGLLYFVSERFDSTLEEWKGSVLTNDGKLEPKFKNIVLNIMQAIFYFHVKLERRNGKVDAADIFLVKGKPKLATVLHCNDKLFVEDYTSFATLVRYVFMRNCPDVAMPYELEHFLGQINTAFNPVYFASLLNHPILLSPKARCHLRLQARMNANNKGISKNVSNYLTCLLPNTFDWKQNVTLQMIKELKDYDKFGLDAVSFLHISRNSSYYVNDRGRSVILYDNIDSELNKIWPEHLCCWFEACINEGVTFSALWKDPLRP